MQPASPAPSRCSNSDWWTMAALGALTTAAYWPGISGAATSPRWATMAAVPWLLRQQRMTAAHWIGGAFIAWSAATLLWTASPLDGGKALFIELMAAACFCLGSQLTSLRGLWVGAALGMTVSSGFAIAQLLGFVPFQTINQTAGLFLNGNYMAEAAALVLVALVAERLWWLIPGVIPALMLPDARGAVLAAGLGLGLHYRRHWAILVSGAVFIAVTATLMSLHHQHTDITQRLEIWQSAFDGVTWFGQGLGSFMSAIDLRAGATLPEYAHNELLHIAFELGVVGLVLAVAFLASLAGPFNAARLVVAAVLVEACFAFPLHLPVTLFLGMVAAGHAVRSTDLLRRGALPGRMDGAAGAARKQSGAGAPRGARYAV